MPECANALLTGTFHPDIQNLSLYNVSLKKISRAFLSSSLYVITANFKIVKHSKKKGVVDDDDEVGCKVVEYDIVEFVSLSFNCVLLFVRNIAFCC